ncbi:hypothetical protein IEO21_07883 [Rhodonia placenta]|uniref:Rho-GAP domain-containing protein n=1 Tax=Rhodonia placenta TaxID=104341 RepID=A0A8H7NXI1_9APHY|nr:hypothetical protein IEO21_07883 [Postia placenta]
MPFYSRRSKVPSSPDSPSASSQTRSNSSTLSTRNETPPREQRNLEHRPSIMTGASERQPPLPPRGILRQPPSLSSASSSRPGDDVVPPSPTTRSNTPHRSEIMGTTKRASLSVLSAGDSRGEKRFSLPVAQLPAASDAHLAHVEDDRDDYMSAPLTPLLHPKVRSVRIADNESDRLARACGQLPASFTTTRPRSTSCTVPSSAQRDGGDELSNRGREKQRRASTGLARPRSRSLSRCPLDRSEKPPPPPYQPPEPFEALRELNVLLQRENQRLEDYIEVEDFLQEKEKEAEARQKRLERIARGEFEHRRDEDAKATVRPRVFGAPLLDALDRSSMPIVIGGQQHEIPTVVHACIEELYRTGIYQNDLFRALPDRARLVELVRTFDDMPLGSAASPTSVLRHASMADVCALLSSFVNSLPNALLDRTIHNALWTWCVRPAVARDDAKREQEMKAEMERYAKAPPKMWRKRSQSEPKTPPSASATPQSHKTPDELRREMIEKERPQVAIARLVLQLIPVENLSLLAYLCAFFTQIPLCPDNGLTFEDIARIFGNRLLGGPSKNAARVLMVWLLNRWSRISAGLFDIEDGVSTKAQKNRETSKPMYSARRPPTPAELDPPKDEDYVAPDEDALYGGYMRDFHLESPSQSRTGRPYSSSVSSQGSSSTYASTAQSELGDTYPFGGSLPYDSGMTLPRRTEHGDRPRASSIPQDRLLRVIEEHEDHQAGRPREFLIPRTPFTAHGSSDEQEFLQKNDFFRADPMRRTRTSDSVYSSEETDEGGYFGDLEPSILRRKTSSSIPRPEFQGDMDASAGYADRRASTPGLPLIKDELSSALERISELERELRVRSQDTEHDAFEPLHPNTDTDGFPAGPPVTSELARTWQGDTGSPNIEQDVVSVKRELNAALSERDDAPVSRTGADAPIGSGRNIVATLRQHHFRQAQPAWISYPILEMSRIRRRAWGTPASAVSNTFCRPYHICSASLAAY